MNRRAIFCSALLATGVVVAADEAGLAFNAGADLRIREEIMENVPGLPGGGVLLPAARTAAKHHMRFRPDVWGEVAGTSADGTTWRLFAKLVDEFRWNIQPWNNKTTFPDELILDNLYLEGKGLLDGVFDLKVGRQNIYNYCGLDHIFVDGTPGDGSRTVYSDMAALTWHAAEDATLDVFALFNSDDCEDLRWGTSRGKHRSLSGLGGGAEPEMDDWGFGAIWSAKLAPNLPYQLFAIQKNTASFERKGVKHSRTQRETLGFKTVPQLTDAWSLQFEGMGQVGANGEGATLSGWSSYVGANWKAVTDARIKPFGRFGFHCMSGDKDAADEDGGHSAWDPMWARAVNDSEMFLYGTHYGAAWWSNMLYAKLTAGLDFGVHHKLTTSCGPLFAAARDGLGGGEGAFKGFLSQARYDFPIILANRDAGERFEMFGHLVAEFFNPGDYYETSKPAYFLRWQVEFKF